MPPSTAQSLAPETLSQLKGPWPDSHDTGSNPSCWGRLHTQDSFPKCRAHVPVSPGPDPDLLKPFVLHRWSPPPMQCMGARCQQGAHLSATIRRVSCQRAGAMTLPSRGSPVGSSPLAHPDRTYVTAPQTCCS